MPGGAVYQAGWTLDDIPWPRFDAARVDLTLLAAVKAASLVEYNAPDYVRYLSRVYRSASPEVVRDIERWGGEEIQHGLALGRWAELADPTFNFQAAFARFLALYRAPHFDHAHGSVRGSRRGEMIARCVVESGTASLYTALRDASDEPVLKEIAGRIAGDEFRHYRMFYEIGRQDDEPDLPRWRKLWIAISRVDESGDDELACAYYCANVPADQTAARPYRRRHYARLYQDTIMSFYRRHHVEKLVKMVVMPTGINPSGRLVGLAGGLIWRLLTRRISGPALRPG
jgi:hypothetical protein